MEIQHVLGFLLLTILGLLSQGFALVHDGHGIMNRAVVGYTSGSYIHPSTGFSGIGVINTNVSLSASVSGYTWSVVTQPASGINSHTFDHVNISWSPVTVVDTMLETVVIKPITTTGTITKLSTIESTTTSTAKYASSTETFTNVVIVAFSTETVYTSTWLAPPKETSYTLTRTSTSVSEAIVVPTDVTYTLTSLPPAPPSTVTTRSLLPMIKRRGSLAWGEAFGNTTAGLGLQNGTGVSTRAASLTAAGTEDGVTRTLTIQGIGPDGGMTVANLTGDGTATHSASVYTHWATKSDTSLGGLAVLSAGADPAIGGDGSSVADATGVTPFSPAGAAPTAAVAFSTSPPLGNHTTTFSTTRSLVPVTTVPSTTMTTTILVLVTITLDDDNNAVTPSTGSGGTSTTGTPRASSDGASTTGVPMAISTVLLAFLGILLVVS